MGKSPLLPLVLAFVGCTASLPEHQKKVQIEFHGGGGMLNRSTTMILAYPNSELHRNREGNRIKIPFRMSMEELMSVYRFLRKNRFNRIGTYDVGEVHDRGGITITVRADGERYKKRNSGSSFISISDRPRFRKIVDEIYRVVSEKTNRFKVTCEIVLEESIWKADKFIHLQSAGNEVGFNSEKEGKQTSLSGDFFPGKHRLYLQLLDKEGPSWNRKSHIRGHFNLEITGETKKIVFFLEDGKIGSR